MNSMNKISSQLKKGSTIYLLFLFLFSLLIRTYKLDAIPPHLTPDEAALGYSAYSIMNTGRDEHGIFLPLVFESFGDWKPGLYSYLAIPFIFFNGLNELSVRLPGAIFGSMAPVFLYLVIVNLHTSKKRFLVSGIASLALAITPWHIHFSRGAWESNVSLTFILMGVYFFTKAMKENSFLILASLSFGLSLLTYHGAKISTMIVLLALIVAYRNLLLKFRFKSLLLSLLVGVILSLPIIFSVIGGQSGRFSVLSVFNATRPETSVEAFLSQSGVEPKSLAYRLFYSEHLNFVRGILGRYFNHFSGRFLFFEGDYQNPRHSAPYSGQLLLIYAPFLVLGIWGLIKNRNNPAIAFFMFWLLVSPIPAALTRDQVHSVRALGMVVPLSYLVGLGASTLIFKFEKFKPILLSAILFAFALNFSFYLDRYFVHLTPLMSRYWEWGLRESVSEVNKLPEETRVVMQQSYAQPYIYFLFYNQVEPSLAQSEITKYFQRSAVGDVGLVSGLGRVSFEYIDWQVLRGRKGIVVIADTHRVPVWDTLNTKEFEILTEIKYPNSNEIAYRVIKIK